MHSQSANFPIKDILARLNRKFPRHFNQCCGFGSGRHQNPEPNRQLGPADPHSYLFSTKCKAKQYLLFSRKIFTLYEVVKIRTPLMLTRKKKQCKMALLRLKNSNPFREQNMSQRNLRRRNYWCHTTSVADPDPRSETRCLFDRWIRDPKKVKKSGSWIRMNNPAHIPESLETIFWVKILLSGSGTEKNRIWYPG
jgi:hypothetical protein